MNLSVKCVEELFLERIEAPNKTHILDNIFRGYDNRIRPYYRGKHIKNKKGNQKNKRVDKYSKSIVIFFTTNHELVSFHPLHFSDVLLKQSENE